MHSEIDIFIIVPFAAFSKSKFAQTIGFQYNDISWLDSYNILMQLLLNNLKLILVTKIRAYIQFVNVLLYYFIVSSLFVKDNTYLGTCG